MLTKRIASAMASNPTPTPVSTVQPIVMPMGKQTWFNTMPKLAQNTIIVATTAVTAFVLYKSYKAYTQWQASKSGKIEVNAIQGTLDTLHSKGIDPSFPDSQYDSWANELQQAMDGCGTNSSVVTGVITKLNNDADVYKLITIYGTKTIGGCSVLGIGSSGVTGSLSQTFAYKGMTVTVNSILKEHEINYRF